MEDSFLGEDLHKISKNLLVENKLYPLSFLCDNDNWKNVVSTIIYPEVGSFSKYLIEKYGKTKFELLYRNTSRVFDLFKNLSEINNIMYLIFACNCIILYGPVHSLDRTYILFYP